MLLRQLLLILCTIQVATSRTVKATSNPIPSTNPAITSPTTTLLSDAAFEKFVTLSALCAEYPMTNLAFRSARTGSYIDIGASKVEATWRSARHRTINDITLVTQLDRTRLHMLRGQCEAWSGPLVAAVYSPLIKGQIPENEAILREITAELDNLHKKVEAGPTTHCALEIVFLTEERNAEDAWAYPYNANRNHAIARARTRLVLLLDADFLPNTGFRERLLKDQTTWKSMVHAAEVEKKVTVFAAFETKQQLGIEQGTAIAARASQASKPLLKDLFDQGQVVQFAPFYKRGHGATNYTKFFSTESPYNVELEVGYEPFILLSRLQVPWFDERFRGYGWDKITHIYQLNYTGFTFEVEPNAWVVHRPHAPSQAYSKTFTGPAYTTKHRPTEELRKLDTIAKHMMAQVRLGVYPASGITSLAGCRPIEMVEELERTGGLTNIKLGRTESKTGEGHLVPRILNEDSHSFDGPIRDSHMERPRFRRSAILQPR